MSASRTGVVALICVLVLTGCGGGGGGSAGGGGTIAALASFTLGAGMSEVAPDPVDTLSSTIDLGRLGVPNLDRIYEFQTPANADFSFTLVGRVAGNAGVARFSVAHAASGGVAPTAGSESIAAAGILLEGPGLGYRGTWLDVSGDGFARLTIRGRINSDQVLVTEATTSNGVLRAGIRIRIGGSSIINVPDDSLPDLPGVTTHAIYSSDSFQCGLPAIATSGDRYSIAAYDGSPTDPFDPMRRRVWLQFNPTTTAVTGGQAQSVAPDSGSWRDQEVAAKGNVLCVAYTGDGHVRMDVSLDRGASFPIQEVFDGSTQAWGQRLVQAAISPGDTIACLFWRSVGTVEAPRSELVLIEAVPTGYDPNDTPTGYAFGAPQILHDLGEDVSPLLMSLVYSSAGDLVIGYGYTRVVPGEPGTLVSQASYRCDIRRVGLPLLHRTIEDVQRVIPADPSVCVVGSGATMRIFYAYEKDDGIHVFHTANAGQTFAQVAMAGSPGAMMPSIHARSAGETLRVDVLFLNPAAGGFELHDLRWDNFYDGQHAVYQLTEATMVPTPPPVGQVVPGQGAPYGGLPGGFTITGVSWFGYDSVTNGDEIAVVVIEQTSQSYAFFWMEGLSVGTPGSGSVFPGPVLLPGMTGTVPPPDAADRNQLKVLIID